jgi:beta-lactam-binding protein with PASTA domain
MPNNTPKNKSQQQAVKRFFVRLWKYMLFRHLLYAVAGFSLLMLIINVTLLTCTQHGKSFPVPDFTGMTLAEAMTEARACSLRLEVVDSVFMPQRQRGTVIRQVPEPYAQVKTNRRVLLSINALTPRKVTVPDVVGYSLRQAKAVLGSQGLLVGKLRYESDIATNNVLAQHYNGTPMTGNEQVYAGSEIDLVLGLSPTAPRTVVPSLMGLTAESARDLLLDNSLNTVCVYDTLVKNYADSLTARVYRQVPAPSVSHIWPMGMKITLYLTLEEHPAKEDTP